MFLSKISSIQSLQIAISEGIVVVLLSKLLLFSILNSKNCLFESSTLISSITARGGGLFFNSSKKLEISLVFPDTSIFTPILLLFTYPKRLYFIARLYTKGRKPTPCTVP